MTYLISCTTHTTDVYSVFVLCPRWGYIQVSISVLVSDLSVLSVAPLTWFSDRSTIIMYWYLLIQLTVELLMIKLMMSRGPHFTCDLVGYEAVPIRSPECSNDNHFHFGKWTVLSGQLVSQKACIAIPFLFEQYTFLNPVSRCWQTRHERTNERMTNRRTDGWTDRQCSNLCFAPALNEPLRNNK